MNNKTLQDILVSDISPNPDNPRLNFDPKDLEDLKISITNAGVLVPITVYENDDTHSGNKYIILDGERRWRCATDLGLTTIPANVVDTPKDITQNILYMFNIHYFRKQWELLPTAIKLEKIIELLKTDKDSVLSSTTGLTLTTVKRCKILLWYPQKYRSMLLYRQTKVSTDFFIELYPIIKRLKDSPSYSSEYQICIVLDQLIEKFLHTNVITDVKEFREIRKALTHYDKKDDFQKFVQLLEHFISNTDETLEIFSVQDIEIDKIKINVLKHISYLTNAFTENDLEIFSETHILTQIEQLNAKLKEVLYKID